MLKRTLGILVAALMIATLATAASGTVDWREPYAEPVTVTVALEEIVNAKFAEGEDMTDNLWTRLFKERFNVDVKVEWVSIEYDTKLNLAIASGALPDIFKCNAVQFDQLKNAGQIQDLKASYETYASPSMKKMMERNWDIVETCMNADKTEILAMPRLHYGFETSTPFVWARKDWTDAAGIKAFATVEDLENAMATFKANNGAEYGIMENKELLSFLQLSASFHAYPRIWIEGSDGSIVYGGIQPEVKEELSYFAKWYQEGFIRKDFTTLDTQAMLQDAFQGKVGLYGQQNWAGWQVGKDMVDNQGEGTYFESYNVPDIDDQKIMYPITFPNSVYNVVRAGYEHPEIQIKLTDCYIDVLDDAIGAGTMTIEQVLPFNTNDMHHITGPFKVEFQHYNDIKEVSSACITGTEKFSTGNAYLFYNEIMKWKNDGDLTSLGRYLQMGYEGASLVKAIDHIDNEQILKTKLWGLQPQVLLDYGTTLEDLLTEGYTQIITGAESIDYFDSLVEEWRAAGGDEATVAVNEMYGAK